jgi:signal transduction histidine kinase/CheY-like chemotaxis protein
VLVVCLLATLGLTLGVEHYARERDDARFTNALQVTRDRIESRLDTYVAVLLATRGFFAGDRGVTVTDFRRLVAQLDLQRRYPGIQGIGFTRRIPAASLAAIEEELRAQGHESFRVWPRSPRGELHAIVLLEPLDRRNRAAIGYDMATDPVRREAMDRARDLGLPAASGKVTLVQEIDPRKQPGFLIYVPVYRSEGIPPTVATRRRDLVGFVYAPFRVDDLLRGIFGSEAEPRLGFAIHDGAPSEESLLHRSAGMASARPPLLQAVETIRVAGRPWTLTFRSRPAFERLSSRWMTPWALGLGLAGSLLLFVLLQRRARAHQQLRAYAREREELLAREREARAEAEDANRAKDEFLAMLGHELRNPLSPIVTALELVAHGPPEVRERAQEVIRRQVGYVIRLVDDLLDVSRITRGKVALEKQPVELATVVAQALEMTEQALEERRVRVDVEVPRGLIVDGDLQRLSQVAANLLTNAAKYNRPGGEVRVSAGREHGEVVLRVRDDGIGIAPELLPRIFDLFAQGQQGLDRTPGGLGIGLTLVRSLVELHGGHVEAHSEGPGHGAELVVRLPAASRAPEPIAPPTSSPRVESRAAAAPRRVLVVDDNREAADLMAELLQAAGHQPRTAYDAAQAIAVAAEQRPEVAILDIGLPVMDGFELARRLGGPGGPRLIAVTGYGQESHRERGREVGFASYLVKPVEPAELLAAIEGGGAPRGAAAR